MAIITILKSRQKFVAVIGGVEVSAKSADQAREKAVSLIAADPLIIDLLTRTREEEAAWWAAKLKIVTEGRFETLERQPLPKE